MHYCLLRETQTSGRRGRHTASPGEETWTLDRAPVPEISVKGAIEMKKIAVLLSVAVILVGAMASAHAAPTIYGVSGLIETPDDTITATKGLSLLAYEMANVGDSDTDITTYGGAFGLVPKVEVAGVGVHADGPGSETSAVFSGKIRLLDESVERPSITVGVVDVANQLDDINGKIDDPSMFVVFGKNIASAAEGLGVVSKPVRGTVGFGTGVYKGVFAGLNWSVAPKTGLMVEYLSNGLRQKSTFNAALRFNPTAGLTVQAGTFAFEGFYVGASYSLAGF